MISRGVTIGGMNRPPSQSVTPNQLHATLLPPRSSSARNAPPSRGSVGRTCSVRCNQGISSSSTANGSWNSLPLLPQLHHRVQQLPQSKPPLHFSKHREGMMNEVHASPVKRRTTTVPGVPSRDNSAISLNSARTTVRFAPYSEILYIPVPSLAELSHADVAALWWSANEFYQHRVEYKATVHLMEQKELQEEKQELQASSEPEAPTFFPSIEGSRGLEQRTETGAWKYYTTKRTASETVLAEQSRLQAKDAAASSIKAVLCLAHVYAQCADLAVKEALERARYDGEQVGIEVEFITPTVTSAPADFVGLPPRGMVKESTSVASGKKIPKGSDYPKPPITPCRHKGKPPFQSKFPARGIGGEDQHHANNHSLNGSHHSVTSRALNARPRLVRETAVSQRHLVDSAESPSPLPSSASTKLASPLDGSHHSATSTASRPQLRREYVISSKRDLQHGNLKDAAKPVEYNLDVASLVPNNSQRSLFSISSRHSVTTTASRPQLRREYVISSKRDLLHGGAKDAASPIEYNLDVASLVPNSSQRSLFSISSQVSSSAGRPKLRRETGVTSKMSLLDNNEKGTGRGTIDRNFPSIIFTADDTNDTTPEGSQRSLNSVSSQISSSSLRPRLRREPTASAKSLLSCKSNKSEKSSSLDKASKHRPHPLDAKEFVMPLSSEEPSVLVAKKCLGLTNLRKERKQAPQMEESVDSFANSLESPLSTSVSSSSSARPGLRRQQSIAVNKKSLTMDGGCATTTTEKDFTKKNTRRSCIRFVDKVVVLPCPRKWSEIGPSEKWLSSHELAEIQDRVNDVIAWMEQGIPVISESNRGLEDSTEVAQQELVDRRRGACHLVLQRQAELRTSKNADVDNVAQIYKAATKEARTVAFVHAKLDTKDAQQHQSMYPCMI